MGDGPPFWIVLAYGHDGKPMLREQRASARDARMLGDRWILRPDVLRVTGYSAAESYEYGKGEDDAVSG